MIKKRKKKVTLTRTVPRLLVIEAEEGGWRSGGIRGGKDLPHQMTSKTMVTGRTAKETVLAMKHKGESLRARR